MKLKFEGKDNTKIKDVKLIKPSGDKVVILNNYPLLTHKQEEGYIKNEKLLDSESLEKVKKKYVFNDNLRDNDMIELGDKVKYKGVNITQLEDGKTQFEFTFECLDKIDYDYVLWMHLLVDDITTANGSNSIGCDHSVEVPMTQWEIGREYKHKYVIKLNKGEYNCVFGFWIPPEGDKLEKRLYDEKGITEINSGWFVVE